MAAASVSSVSLPAIENAIREVCCALSGKNHRLPSWETLTEDDLWRELVACILGSRVRFEIAHSAVERLNEKLLLCQVRRSSCFEQYEQDIKETLAEVTNSNDGFVKQSCYPFFRIRAKQIRLAAERLYGCHETIRAFLGNSCDSRDARRRLASEISGLGPKQASLFLRNIGYSAYVAVLDIHVLTYMSWIGLTDAPLKSVSTIKKYEALETTFIEHSHSLGYAPDHFDIAVWVVVRVAKGEMKMWE